jgi:prepilin-type N-terminal cleavage/methylation domain-containing protein
MYCKNSTRGFTLIELLVVIAIIGLLSSFVLAALNTARQKANDATIENDSQTIVSQSELYYESNGTYGSAASTTVTTPGGVCSGGMFSDPTIIATMKAMTSVSGSATLFNVPGSYMGCGSGTQYWLVVVPLATDPTHVWCVGWYNIPHKALSISFNASPAPSC